jgi:hypothetical protein
MCADAVGIHAIPRLPAYDACRQPSPTVARTTAHRSGSKSKLITVALAFLSAASGRIGSIYAAWRQVWLGASARDAGRCDRHCFAGSGTGSAALNWTFAVAGGVDDRCIPDRHRVRPAP